MAVMAITLAMATSARGEITLGVDVEGARAGTTSGALFLDRLELTFDNGAATATVAPNQHLVATGLLHYAGNGTLHATWSVDGRPLQVVVHPLVYGTTATLTGGEQVAFPTFEPGNHVVELEVVGRAPDGSQTNTLTARATYFVETRVGPAADQTLRLLTPYDGAAVDLLSQRFTWTAGPAASRQYKVQLFENARARTGTAPAVVMALTGERGLTLSSRQVARLTPGATYRWTVEAYDARGRLLATSAPAAVTNATPGVDLRIGPVGVAPEETHLGRPVIGRPAALTLSLHNRGRALPATIIEIREGTTLVDRRAVPPLAAGATLDLATTWTPLVAKGASGGGRGRVQDAHGRVSNLDTGAQLGRLEAHAGVAPLASNLDAGRRDLTVRVLAGTTVVARRTESVVVGGGLTGGNDFTAVLRPGHAPNNDFTATLRPGAVAGNDFVATLRPGHAPGNDFTARLRPGHAPGNDFVAVPRPGRIPGQDYVALPRGSRSAPAAATSDDYLAIPKGAATAPTPGGDDDWSGLDFVGTPNGLAAALSLPHLQDTAGVDFRLPATSRGDTSGVDFRLPATSLGDATGVDFVIHRDVHNDLAGLDFTASPRGDNDLAGLDFTASPRGDNDLAGLDFTASPRGDNDLEGLDFTATPRGDNDLAGLDFTATPRGDNDLAGLDFIATPRGDNDLAGLNFIATPRGDNDLAGLDFTATPRGNNDLAGLDFTATPRSNNDLAGLDFTASPRGHNDLAGLDFQATPIQNWVVGVARELRPAERQLARRIFGDSLDLDRIRINSRIGASDRAWTSYGLVRQRPPLLGNHLNVGQEGYLADMSQPVDIDPAPGSSKPHPLRQADRLLIHELTHVWQSQHHGNPLAYMVNSVCSQAISEPGKSCAYLYTPGKPFGSYAAEQIASIVEDYYLAASGPLDIDTDGNGKTDTKVTQADLQPILDVIRGAAPNAEVAANVESLAAPITECPHPLPTLPSLPGLPLLVPTTPWDRPGGGSPGARGSAPLRAPDSTPPATPPLAPRRTVPLLKGPILRPR